MLNCILSLINCYNLKKYKVIKEISNNKKSVILLVKNKRKDYCMKIVKNDKKAAREIKILMNNKNNKNNKYLLKYINSFRANNNIYIITNYIPEGDLLTFVNSFNNLSYYMIKNIIYKMLIPIYYLHESKYAHLDIKFENYLIRSNNHIDIDIILIDYECCHKLRSFINYLKYNVGTNDYRAPEILMKKIYGKYSDIWSIGICLLKLLIGDNLFLIKKKTYTKIDIEKNLEEVKNNHPHFYVRLLNQMLNRNIMHRIDLLELIYFLEIDLRKYKEFIPINLT
jgi:serine/threonine protein kinase